MSAKGQAVMLWAGLLHSRRSACWLSPERSTNRDDPTMALPGSRYSSGAMLA
jgi:hypothetical protein